MVGIAQRRYALVGHVTCDKSEDGCTLGGTVTFAGRTVSAFGWEPSVLTSAPLSYNLMATSLYQPGMRIRQIVSEEITTFFNQYQGDHRQQMIAGQAMSLHPRHWPKEWDWPELLHLAPVAGEVDDQFLSFMPAEQTVVLTPQGWMRRWDQEGRVSPTVWACAEQWLRRAAAVVLSEDDFPDPALITQYAAWSNLLVVTRASAGCTVFWRGEVRDFSAPVVQLVEATGAGDIFAASFFCRFFESGDAWLAAQFANRIASQSVTQMELSAKIDAIKAIYSQ